MSQSRGTSLLEAAVNVAAGWCVALLLTLAVLPVFGPHPSLARSLRISLVFTAASLIRSCVIRRIFERVARTPAGPTPPARINLRR